MKKILFVFVVPLLFCFNKEKNLVKTTQDTTKKEALLIGTFHYDNPGVDVSKTKSFDILNDKSQNELDNISDKIKVYNPSKIFVEWPYNEQKQLDSLYQLYLNDSYFSKDNLSDFYLKNEIFQLAFRVAKKNKHNKVYAMDYRETNFPFNDVMNDVAKNNQTALQSEIQKGINKFTTEFDNKIDTGVSLTELTLYLNSPKLREFSNSFHNNIMLLAGDINEFSGPLLTAEWFKRNLYMWSIIQKQVSNSDERIMILAGASHIAMFELFIKENENWQVKELKEIIQ